LVEGLSDDDCGCDRGVDTEIMIADGR
jgi:hypothetical protein